MLGFTFVCWLLILFVFGFVLRWLLCVGYLFDFTDLITGLLVV